MLNRDYRRDLLRKYSRSPEDDTFLARLLDKYELWQRDGRLQYTRFLTERDKLCCVPVLRELGAGDAFFWGGYEEAERTLLLFPAQWQEPEGLKGGADTPVAVIRAAWKSGETLSHRDFLGALMSLGIEREMVGDILPREEECDILLMREIGGLSYDELAKELRLEVGTVKSRLNRARKKLCALLAESGNFSGSAPSKERKGGAER